MFVTFGAYVSYGKLDSVNYEIEVELTEVEYERVKASCLTHWRMRDDSEIADIYDKVYKAALDLDVDVLKKDKKMLAEKMAWYLDITEDEAILRDYTEEEIVDMLENEGDRGVSYPVDLEEELNTDDAEE